nr:dehydratase [Desulfobacterales bacterium]
MEEKYFQDFEVGEKFISPTRTVTETDVILFAGLTGDNNLIHTDEMFAKKTQFKTRIAHGLLGLSLGMGLFQRLGIMASTAMAYLGIEKLEFTYPIRLGDTIRSEATVIDKRESKKGGRGIVRFRLEVFNHEDQLVQKGEHIVMIAARGGPKNPS